MTDLLKTIRRGIEDLCDYCMRAFRREAGEPAICPCCGLENIRKPKPAPAARESATLRPPERAVRPSPRAHTPAKRKPKGK